MSGLRVSNLRGVAGSAPTFPDGVVVTGVSTATTFDGNLTGNVTGNVVGNVTGDVTGNITGTTGSFSGNVSVGGTLTYNDVTNVDSVGVVTARGGIKVGAGQSISAVSGIITYYGDGSQLQGIESGVSNFVASGTIANGKAVVVNTDGTVGVVTTTTVTSSAGTPVVFNSGNSTPDVVFDSTNNKVVVVYTDDGNSGKGTAIVGTVSGTSISFGSEVVFNNGNTAQPKAAFVGGGKVVVTYRDSGNNQYGTAVVGTISGTSISFGSEVVFQSVYASMETIAYDSTNDRVVISYKNESNNTASAIVGTVSGTSISFGSPTQFHGNLYNIDNTFVSGGKVVVAYRDTGNSNYGTARVGTVSGTSISFGSEVVFESSSTGRIDGVYDSINDKLILAYSDGDDSDKGKAVVGTVSGTSISFGTPVTYNNATTSFPGIAFDDFEKVIIAYNDGGNSNYGTAIEGTVSGTSISFGSEVVYETANSWWNNATYDSLNNKVVIVYQDRGNSNYGTSVVYSVSGTSTNLTSENYIGIAAEAISNGATGKVTIFGGTNSGQTGLTTAQTYYVQTDGSLSTSAGNPSVVAGTSISSTKIIVKG